MPMVRPQQISAEDYLGENTQISADEYLADEQPSGMSKAWESAKQQYPLAGILNTGKVMESLYEKLDESVGTPRSPYATEPPTPNEQLYEQTTGGDPRAKLGNLALRAGTRLVGGTAAFFPQLLASLIDPQSQGAESRTDATRQMAKGAVESIASVLPNAFDLTARTVGVDDPSALLPKGWQMTYQDLVNKAYASPDVPIMGMLLAHGGVKLGKSGVGAIKDLREAKQAAIMRDRFAREEAIKRRALDERLAEKEAMTQVEDVANAGPVGQRVGMRPAHEPQNIESGTPFTQPETPITGGMRPIPRDNVLAPRTGDPTLDLAIESGAPKTNLPATDSPKIGQPRANVVQNPRGSGMKATIVPVAGAGLGAAAIYQALNDDGKDMVKAGIGEGFSGLGMVGLMGAMLVGGKKPSEYLKSKGIKAPASGSLRPTIDALSTAVGGDVLMGMRQVQTPLSGPESVVRAKNTIGEVVKNFTPSIYSIDKLGKGAKELFYDPVVSGLNVVTREAKPAQLAFRSLLKEAGIGIRNYGDVSKKIATFAIAQQKNGIELLKGMGITAIPKLTPQELAVYKYMRQQYELLHPRLNEARKVAGLREIGYTDDYFTFARNMEDWLQSGQAIDGGKLFIEGQETIPLADQTAAGFTKSRGTSTAQLQLDAFGTFESYLNSAARHIHLTPLLAEQARMLTKNYGTAKNPWYLQDKNPGAYMELRDWINQQAGYQLPQRSQILSGAVSRFTQRMVRAGLSFNVQSMVIQPTAYANFVAQHGAKWGAEGAKVLFDERLRQMAMDKSRVLYGREHDISVTRGREGQIGVLGRVAEKTGDVGMNPLQKLDLLTAEATWYGAYQKALQEMKLPENKAIIYADDIVTKTQGSASTADIAPIQRTPWGKALTAYNTFTINNINWLARELPGSGSKLSQTGRVGRYILGTMLINYAYEQAGFNSPIPNPLSAFAGAMGDDKKNPFQESIKETIGMFPVVGGASQYGSSSLGATSQLLDDMIGVGTGQKGARATVQTTGKLLGIPGTTQAVKLLFPDNEKK